MKPSGANAASKATLVERHNKGKSKYTKYQLSKIKETQMQEAIKGKKREELVPRPGEFVIVATDHRYDPQKPIAVPMENILQRTAPLVQESLRKIRSIPVVSMLRQEQFSRGPEEGSEQDKDPSRPQTQQPNFFGLRSPSEEEGVRMDEDPEEFIKNWNDDEEEEKEGDVIETLEKKNYKTSMTTNLKNIMRRQQRDLLTSSSNLMHTGVLHHILREAKERPATIRNLAAVPSSKRLVRPASSYALIKKSKAAEQKLTERKEASASKITINGARLRDKKTEKWNSYKVMANQYTRMHSAQKREIAIPTQQKDEVLLKQEALLRENVLTSPFMKTQEVQAIPVDKNYDIKPQPPAPVVNDNDATDTPSGKQAVQQLQNGEEDFHTLPLEAYDPCIDTEKGDQLLEFYRGERNGRVHGRSRWFYPDGTSEFRECEVLSYDKEENRYVIKWDSNGIMKKASRFNIRIDGEDVRLLLYRVDEALKNRTVAERIIQCTLLIDNIATPEPDLPADVKERVSFYVRSVPVFDRPYRNVQAYLALTPQARAAASCSRYQFPIGATERFEPSQAAKTLKDEKRVQTLYKEVDKDYKRAFRVTEFEAQLPYKGTHVRYNSGVEEYYQRFKDVMPVEKFRPVAEKIIEETSRRGVIDIGERSKPFFGLLREMNKKLHQGDQKKLETLVSVNTNFNKLSRLVFFGETYTRSVELKTFFEINMVKAHDHISNWKESMIQASNEIKDMVLKIKDQIDEEIKKRLKAASHESAKKNIGESRIPEETVQTLARFQSLVNFIFERGIRQSFEQSVDRFIHNFDEVLEFLADSLSIPPEKLQQTALDIEKIRQVADDAVFKKRMEKRMRLKCEIKYKASEGVYIRPKARQWKRDILRLIDEVIKLIVSCPCLFTSELDYARKSRLVLVIADAENDAFAVSRKLQLEKILDALLYVPSQLINIANGYREILDADRDVLKEKYSKTTVSNEEYDQELQRLCLAQERLETLFAEDLMFLGLFEVNCKKLRELFAYQISKLKKQMFQCIKGRIGQDAEDIDVAVKEIIQQLEKEPPAIEELVDQNRFLQTIETRRVDIQNIIIALFSKVTLLEQYHHPLTEKELHRAFAAFMRTLDIVKLKREAMVKNSTLWGKYKDDLRAETAVLLLDAGKLKEKLDQLQLKTEIKDYGNISYEYNQLGDQIGQAISKSEVIITRERLFMLPNTSFEELYNTKKLFQPYETLWNITRDYFYHYPQWTTGPITDLDREKLNKEVNGAIATLKSYISNEFLSDPEAQRIGGVVLQHFVDFKPMLPLIYDLRNPSMQKRHWDALKQSAEIEIPADGQISLKELLTKGIEKHKEQINEISDFATKERELLQASTG